MPFPFPVRTMTPDLLRGLLTTMVALALAGAPSFVALGIGHDVQERGEPGAAGILPFAADPGHRMSAGSSAPGAASPGATTAPSRWSALRGPSVAIAATSHEGIAHAWLRLLLIGARLQTDGG